MNKKVNKVVKHISLLILLHIVAVFSVSAQYTLTDADVVITDGIIESCSYDSTIKDIVIPETLDGQTVVGIKNGSGVFKDKGITSIVLPATLTFIGSNAFYKNSITSLDLSNCTALTTIGNSAFERNSIASLDLSNCTALTTIDVFAFRFNSLTRLNLSNCTALTSIRSFAFTSNLLNQVYLPRSITFLGWGAFNDNKINLVNGSSSNGIFYARNYDASIDNTTIVSYGGAADNLIIPEQVIKIRRYAFQSGAIKSVDFSNCTALTTIENYAFFGNSLTSLDLSACTALRSIGDAAFCSNSLTSLDLSACTGLTSINSRAFESNLLTSLDLSACIALRNIGVNAFNSNEFTAFDLPTPNIATTQFNYWQDENGNEYAGGATVNDLSTSYKADVTGSLNVTFKIIDGTDIVSGATIDFGSYGEATSDASGIATFTNVLPENDVPYIIKIKFVGDIFGTVSIIDSDVSKVVQLDPTGISKMDNNKINIYPNPAQNILTITQPTDGEIISIELYSLQGQKKMVKNIVNNQKIIKLNVRELEPGIYILKCFTRNNHIFSRKIMIE